MYDLVFSQLAEKQFSKLDGVMKQRIIAVLERIRIRPENHLKKLVGGPEYSLRAGDYRIIVDLNKNKLHILVIEIGHRSNVYDRR